MDWFSTNYRLVYISKLMILDAKKIFNVHKTEQKSSPIFHYQTQAAISQTRKTINPPARKTSIHQGQERSSPRPNCIRSDRAKIHQTASRVHQRRPIGRVHTERSPKEWSRYACVTSLIVGSLRAAAADTREDDPAEWQPAISSVIRAIGARTHTRLIIDSSPSSALERWQL